VVEQIVREFDPERIYLFGSYAYGRPVRDSDVDLLVVMPTRDERAQAVRIRMAIDPPFAWDIMVRTPSTMEWRLREEDWFLREIVELGILCHEKNEALTQNVHSRPKTRIYSYARCTVYPRPSRGGQDELHEPQRHR
jgi:predicted nucleotidyltransferase